MDIIVEGSSTVISKTPLSTEYDQHDHDAGEQQGKGNSTTEQVPSDDDAVAAADDDDNNDDDMNDDEERMIYVLIAVTILFVTYLMWCDSKMDIVVAGSSTVISKTPFVLKEYDHHDHNAGEQQEQGNSTAEQEPYDHHDHDAREQQEQFNRYRKQEQEPYTCMLWVSGGQMMICVLTKTHGGIFFLVVVVILFMTSLNSFWNNYVKYYGYFCRWLFLVIIINIITDIISPYQIGGRYHQYRLETSFLQFVRLATSVWFFYVAKLIHQQLIILDRRVQRKQATTASKAEFIDTEQHQHENNNHTAVDVDTTTILPRLLPNYDNIYGQVSRKIDRFFQRQQQQHLPTDEDILLSTRSSCLVNFSYVLWSLYLSASFYGFTDLVIFHYYESWSKACDDNDPELGQSPWNSKTECIQEISLVGSTIVAVLMLIGTGYWLLICQGLPSGIIPFVVTIVGMWYLSLVKGVFNDFGAIKSTIIVMTLGTILFHIMICCCYNENHSNNNSNTRTLLLRHVHLPSWITRNVLIYAVYGWIGAFSATGAFDYRGSIFIMPALLLFAYTGIVLHHPIIQLMGICTIVLSTILYWLDINNDFYLSLNMAMMGVGLIVLGNWISKTRNNIITRCRYVFRFCCSIILCRAATYTD